MLFKWVGWGGDDFVTSGRVFTELWCEQADQTRGRVLANMQNVNHKTVITGTIYCGSVPMISMIILLPRVLCSHY